MKDMELALSEQELIYDAANHSVYTVEGLKQYILQLYGIDKWSALHPLFNYVDWEKWITDQKTPYIKFSIEQEFNNLLNNIDIRLNSYSKVIYDRNRVVIRIKSKKHFDEEKYYDTYNELASPQLRDTYYITDIQESPDGYIRLFFDVITDDIEYCFCNAED